MFPDLSVRSNPLKEALLWDRASMDPNARNAKRATRVKPTRTRRLRLNLRIDCDVALAIVSACHTLRLPLFFSAMKYRTSCTSCDFFLDELVPQFGRPQAKMGGSTQQIYIGCPEFWRTYCVESTVVRGAVLSARDQFLHRHPARYSIYPIGTITLLVPNVHSAAAKAAKRAP